MIISSSLSTKVLNSRTWFPTIVTHRKRAYFDSYRGTCESTTPHRPERASSQWYAWQPDLRSIYARRSQWGHQGGRRTFWNWLAMIELGMGGSIGDIIAFRRRVSLRSTRSRKWISSTTVRREYPQRRRSLASRSLAVVIRCSVSWCEWLHHVDWCVTHVSSWWFFSLWGVKLTRRRTLPVVDRQLGSSIV